MMEDIFQFDSPSCGSSYIKVIGVGGGGSNAVNHMFIKGINGVDFIICNTDKKSLDMSPVPSRIQLGIDGLGAGNLPDVAQRAAEGKADEIKEMLSNGTKMIFITAGMGGGTGTGAAPVIARIAKEIDVTGANGNVQKILTVAIVTRPFTFEGKKRREQAENGIAELKKYADVVLVINNDKLRDFGDLSMEDAFAKANDVLLTAAKGIAEIITVTAHVAIDFNDVNTVMANSGVALMGSGIASGEDRAIIAIEEAVASPLLDDNDICGARDILLYISYNSSKGVTMDEITAITDYLTDSAGKDVDVIWGYGKDESLADGELKVTLIATGFEKKSIGNTIVQGSNIGVIQAAPVVAPVVSNQGVNIAPVQTENITYPIGGTTTVLTDEVQVQKQEMVNSGGNRFTLEDAAADVNKTVEETKDATIQALQASNSSEPVLISKKEEQTAAAAIAEWEPKLISQPVAVPVVEPEPVFQVQPQQIETQFVPQVESAITPMAEPAPASINPQDRAEKLKRLSLSLDSLKEAETLEAVEKVPAYLRRNQQLDIATPSNESEKSSYQFNTDEQDGFSIKRNNSFLHDNAD